ncbi:hypothetical protein TraAM80_05899, partial [Trypanosoma rangeli]
VTQPYSATTPLPGGMAGATAVTQPYSATTPLPGGMAGATAVTQPYSATTPLPGGMTGATAVTQPYSATTPLPGGMTGATAIIGSQLECQAVSVANSAPPHGEILAALARAAAIEGAESWKGVKWTNKNVGNYIQRRFYGAEPSLRAPDIEKQKHRKKCLPNIRVVPLSAKKGSGELGPTAP